MIQRLAKQDVQIVLFQLNQYLLQYIFVMHAIMDIVEMLLIIFALNAAPVIAQFVMCWNIVLCAYLHILLIGFIHVHDKFKNFCFALKIYIIE